MSKRYLALLLVAVVLLAGCSATDVPETTESQPIIGICLPDKTWEAEAKLLSAPLSAAGHLVEVNFANGDPQIQLQQLQTLLSRPLKLLILCPIDSFVLTEQLTQVKEKNIPVLAYDRMLMHTDAVTACVAVDTYSAGKQLGQYILDNTRLDTREKTATMEMFMGTPEDQNAYLFHKGLMSVLHPYWENGKLTAPSGRISFEDTCIQNADPHTARAYFLDYLLEDYNETLPDILCTGGIGIAQRCAETFPEDEEEIPLTVGLGEKGSAEPFSAYACFDRELLAKTCVQWALSLLVGPASLPKNTTQNNGIIDVPTFLLAPEIVK